MSSAEILGTAWIAPEIEPPARSRGGYAELLARLARQSVVKHHDAYADVAWDAPEHAIAPEDPCWERDADDPLGATPWYRAQPGPVRARIGLHLIAAQMRLGIEFENVLQRGLLEFALTLPDGDPAFRYAYHEVVEEGQHSLMFNELLRRTGLHVPGLPWLDRLGSRRVVRLGRQFPELFFLFVLGGEEPIDHVQRETLRARATVHPLLRRVMQIHVTEEARHLCFARAYLREHVPRLSRARRASMALQAPLLLGEMARQMLHPSAHVVRTYGIPRAVVRQAYTQNPRHRAAVAESLASVRALCEELGLATPVTARLWRRVGAGDLGPA